MSKASDSTSDYVFPAVNTSDQELERLDVLHRSMTEYFDGRLGYAPLDDVHPKKVIDIGAGSGAWAIDAAVKFPDATVIAVDISPMPTRAFPQNCHCEQADITKSLPFEDGSFDVVHARWVIMHVPQPREVLSRIFKLVKPGGWLIIEEPDTSYMRAAGPVPPGWATYISAWLTIMDKKGCEITICRELASLAQASGYFDTINSQKVEVPLSGSSETDTKVNRLGLAHKASMKRVVSVMSERHVHPDITSEVAKRCLEELENADTRLTLDTYFFWARKRVD